MNNYFKLAQPLFHTIQGEGASVGKNVVFMRVAKCQLSCKYCDTKYSWGEGKYVVTFEQIINYITQHNCNGIVITGGQPLLYKDDIISFMKYLYSCSQQDIIDKIAYNIQIETNGAIPVTQFYDLGLTQFNVSPKLSNSGMDVDKRIISDALNSILYSPSNISYLFKFVVSNQDDVKQVLELVNQYDIPRQTVYLMPECTTRDQQLELQEKIINMCLEHGFNYSPRLHVIVWNNKKGV